jgi:MFS family permease
MQSAGWLISAIVLPRVADLKGRKWVVFGALTLQLVCMAATFFSTNLATTAAIMFFLGLTGVGRMSVSILYLMEFIPNNNKPFCGTSVVLNNAATYLYCAIYFWQISPQWKWLECFASGMTLFCAIGVLLLPESPKFLITLKRFDEARRSLSYIAKINGCGTFKEKF